MPGLRPESRLRCLFDGMRVRALLRSTPVRFALVGIWNTIFSAACFAGLYALARGRYYMLVLLASTILGVTNSFAWHRAFTFRSRSPLLTAYLRFYLVYGVQIGLNFLLLPLAVEVLDMHPVVAQLLIVGGTTILTYFAHRDFSFGGERYVRACPSTTADTRSRAGDTQA